MWALPEFGFCWLRVTRCVYSIRDQHRLTLVLFGIIWWATVSTENVI